MGVEVSAVVTMKHRSGEASLLPDQAHELRAELARKIASFIGSEESLATEISGLTLGTDRYHRSVLNDLRAERDSNRSGAKASRTRPKHFHLR